MGEKKERGTTSNRKEKKGRWLGWDISLVALKEQAWEKEEAMMADTCDG